jgi:hypothetical protein
LTHDITPFVIAGISVLGNTLVVLFVYFNKRNYDKINSKADKKDTNLIFKFIKEIGDKLENNFVKKDDCKDFKTRIGGESDTHRKSIESLKIGVAVLLKNSGTDPSIMEIQ